MKHGCHPIDSSETAFGDLPVTDECEAPSGDLPRFLDISDVAALFNRSPRTVRWWIQVGRLRVVRVGRAVFVSEAEIRRLLDGQE